MRGVCKVAGVADASTTAAAAIVRAMPSPSPTRVGAARHRNAFGRSGKGHGKCLLGRRDHGGIVRQSSGEAEGGEKFKQEGAFLLKGKGLPLHTTNN